MSPSAPLLIRRRVAFVVALCVTVFTSAVAVLQGVGEAPSAFLGSGDILVLTSSGVRDIVRSSLPQDLAESFRALPNVTAVSAEIFAFSAIGEEPVVLRGAEPEDFFALEAAVLTTGRLPSASFEILAGDRVAERLGLVVGNAMTLVGTFRPKLAEVRLVGIFHSDEPTADEFVVPLSLARLLSSKEPGEVSIIRLRSTTPEQFARWLSPEGARFSLTNFEVKLAVVSIDATVPANVTVLNWGLETGTVGVSFREDGTVLATEQVTLGPYESKRVGFPYAPTVLGPHLLSVRLDADPPLTLNQSVVVRNPFLVLRAPARIPQGGNLELQVLDGTLRPVEGALVSFQGQEVLTNATGGATLTALAAGSGPLSASKAGLEGASLTVEVLPPGALPEMPVLHFVSLSLLPQEVRAGSSALAVVTVENAGNRTGTFDIDLSVDGQVFATQSVTLEPLEVKMVNFAILRELVGNYEIAAGPFAATLSVVPKAPPNPALVDLFLRYGGRTTAWSTSGELIYRAARISEGNVTVALVAMGSLAALLITLGIAAVVLKEVTDRARAVGVLRSVGASDLDLVARLFREVLPVALPAALAGVLLGAGLASLLTELAPLRAFGHSLEPVLDVTTLSLALIGGVVSSIAASLVAGQVLRGRTPVRMLRGLGVEREPPLELAELLREQR